MKNANIRLLCVAAALLFLSGCLFAVISLWVYAVLALAGALCCGAAAVLFHKNNPS